MCKVLSFPTKPRNFQEDLKNRKMLMGEDGRIFVAGFALDRLNISMMIPTTVSESLEAPIGYIPTNNDQYAIVRDGDSVVVIWKINEDILGRYDFKDIFTTDFDGDKSHNLLNRRNHRIHKTNTPIKDGLGAICDDSGNIHIYWNGIDCEVK